MEGSGVADGPGSVNGRLMDFLLQAGANALGTVASGVVLGGVAVRLGLLDVNEDSLSVTAGYALLAGAIVGVLAAFAAVTLILLAVIEPHRRAQHRRLLFHALEVAAGLGVVVTTVFWAAVMIASWDPEGLIVWVTIVAALLCTMAVLRALRRRFGAT
jgi:hypothetical protein